MQNRGRRNCKEIKSMTAILPPLFKGWENSNPALAGAAESAY
jgi:hypothetical protein